jgi:hypothetical protein
MADELDTGSEDSPDLPKRSGAAARIERSAEIAKRAGEAASDRAQRASSAARRWIVRASSVVGTQTATGVELTRAKRDQLRCQRQIDRLEKSVGQMVAREYAPGKESIAVLPDLARELDALCDARSELDVIGRQIGQARDKLRQRPTATGPTVDS